MEKIDNPRLLLLLEELESTGYMPESLHLTKQQAKIIARADAKATSAALRTITNPTYKSLSQERKAQVLSKIFSRHRLAVMRSLGMVPKGSNV